MISPNIVTNSKKSVSTFRHVHARFAKRTSIYWLRVLLVNILKCFSMKITDQQVYYLYMPTSFQQGSDQDLSWPKRGLN